MAKRKSQQDRGQRGRLRERLQRAVSDAFPGCIAEFVGQQSRAALVGRTFGFRVKDANGRHRSNIIWLNPEHRGSFSAAWLQRAVAESNR